MATGTLVGLMLMFGVVVALPAIFALLHIDDYAGIAVAALAGADGRDHGDADGAVPVRPVAAAARDQAAPVAGRGDRDARCSSWSRSGSRCGSTQVATYDVVYGTFGSVIVVMLWFYLSMIALVLGGFVNAELERHAGAPAPDRSMY